MTSVELGMAQENAAFSETFPMVNPFAHDTVADWTDSGMVGLVTDTVKEQVAGLSTPLDAVHVTLEVPTGNEEPEATGVDPSEHVVVGIGAPLATRENETGALQVAAPPGADTAPGHVIDGVRVTTETVKPFEARFPNESVALQVTAVEPTGNLLPEEGEQPTGTAPLTLSTALGGAQETMAPDRLTASTTSPVGTPVRTGGVVSRTVTEKLAEATFRYESVALHVTLVKPIENAVPDPGEHVTGNAPLTMSTACGAGKVTTAPYDPVASSVRLAGTPVMAGGVVSTTTTLNGRLATLPLRSLAEQVTVVTPSGKVDPEAGRHDTATAPSKLSTAVTTYVIVAPAGLVASKGERIGVWMTGGPMSIPPFTATPALRFGMRS
jgi:hypothetical protein